MQNTGHNPTQQQFNNDLVNRAIEIEKAREQKLSTENKDFVNGQGDDPHARGAESSADFILNN